ncbi:MAG: FHA domain-containing protein [Dehalococcoidia bacterium]
MPFLIVKELASGARVFRLGAADVVIGRDAYASVPLEGVFASRAHAAIRPTGCGFVLEDCRSKNGTWLNGARLTSAVRLSHGDEIVIGGASLVFMDDDADLRTWTGPLIAATGVEVDAGRRVVRLDGRPIEASFSPQEFELLALLWANGGRVCSRQAIGDRVWGPAAGSCPPFDVNMVHQLVHRLRNRLAAAGIDHYLPIVTVAGVGYRLDAPTQGARA